MHLRVESEYQRLEAVLVHRPGEEIDRLTHDNLREYLFEDVPFLRRMQEEHDRFTQLMRDRGIIVYYLENLLAELLNNTSMKRRIVQEACAAELAPEVAADLLDERVVPAKELRAILFRGLTRGERAKLTGGAESSDANPRDFLLRPIPNAFFSRDPGVVIHDSAICCKMAFAQRQRESLLVRAVLELHPEFSGGAITYGSSDFPTEDRPFTIEGGDVAVLNDEAVLIGALERTRSATIEILAQKALDIGPVRRVYEIPIPTERLFMHLDTVFTIVDRGTVVWYPGVMHNIKQILHYEEGPGGGVVRKNDSRNLLQILGDEFGCPVKVIETAGGDEHYASREQRTDGTNVFAIAPRVVVGYERNERTAAAMEKAGIECLTIPGSELVRGLGGPRCMTMPLRRAAGATR